MLFARRVEQIFQNISSTFFAEKVCVVCHVPYIPAADAVSQSASQFLCDVCFLQILPKAVKVCHRCGQMLTPSASGECCLACKAMPPLWDELRFYAPYGGMLQQMILYYKYGKNFSLAPVLANFLYEASLSLPTYDVLIPMPRHKKRLAEQGYNQMAELCRILTKLCSTPFCLQALRRTRYTLPQASLLPEQRRANPVKSFIAKHVLGKRVLLVDDVMTTGATLHHASLALQKAGAVHISVLLLARAEKEL